MSIQFTLLGLCVQACLIQVAYSQTCGCNQYSYGSSSQSCGSYGGSGTGQVGVSGNIDACGNTCVTGSVPVLSSVEFGGCAPACGSVSISAKCSCDCQCEQTVPYSPASNYISKPSGGSSSINYLSAVQQTTPCINRTPSISTSSYLNAPCAGVTKPSTSLSAPRVCKQPSSQSAPGQVATARISNSLPSLPSTSVTSVSSAPSLSLNTPIVSNSVPSLGKPGSSLCKPGITSLQPSSGCGYGGSGTGEVSTSGNIDACGATCVTGTVPVIGSVEFSGCSPTCGSVEISAQCECDCK